jgi:hypothetical protein
VLGVEHAIKYFSFWDVPRTFAFERGGNVYLLTSGFDDAGRTLRNGWIGRRGDSGRICPCGSGKKYKLCCGGGLNLHPGEFGSKFGSNHAYSCPLMPTGNVRKSLKSLIFGA